MSVPMNPASGVYSHLPADDGGGAVRRTGGDGVEDPAGHVIGDHGDEDGCLLEGPGLVVGGDRGDRREDGGGVAQGWLAVVADPVGEAVVPREPRVGAVEERPAAGHDDATGPWTRDRAAEPEGLVDVRVGGGDPTEQQGVGLTRDIEVRGHRWLVDRRGCRLDLGAGVGRVGRAVVVRRVRVRGVRGRGDPVEEGAGGRCRAGHGELDRGTARQVAEAPRDGAARDHAGGGSRDGREGRAAACR